MFNSVSKESASLTQLQEVNKRISELMPRLEKANQTYADAIKPLNRLSELDSAQRVELAKTIRNAVREWDEVTRQVDEAQSLFNRYAGSPQSGK